MVHKVSQIIAKNLHRRRPCETGLWINPENDSVWQDAKQPCSALSLFCQQYSSFVFHQQSGGKVEFGPVPNAVDSGYQWIILNLPRQKALLSMMLDCAAGLLSEGGVLWLAGENKAGIKSADKLLRSRFSTVSKIDNARHCTLYEAGNPLPKSTFDLQSYQQQWLLDFRESEIKLASYPGVFAHGRLDAGTALLLDTVANMNFSGDILDFGCGAGVIGACIAAANADARLTFLDNSALALKACEDTVAVNQLNAKLLASDGLSAVNGTFDVVITNPPIHEGIKTDNQLGMRLLELLHQHIGPAGELILVANRHLPYERWLSVNFQQVREVTANSHFKVLSAKLAINR